MRRILVVALMWMVALANVRVAPVQFAGLSPVASTAVVDGRVAAAAGVTREQRPLPLSNEDMQRTQGSGFWSSFGDFMERLAGAVLEGLVIGLILGLGICETNPQVCGI